MSDQWFLISKETTKFIGDALQKALDELPESQTREALRDALHWLDSGLHITNDVPTDYQKQN